MLQMTKRVAQINTNERLEYRFSNIFIWDTGKRRSQTYPNRLKWTKQKSKNWNNIMVTNMNILVFFARLKSG